MEVTSYSVTFKCPMSLCVRLRSGTYPPEQLEEYLTVSRGDDETSERKRDFDQCLKLVKWANTCSAREVKVVSLSASVVLTFIFGCIDFLVDFDSALYRNFVDVDM